MNDQGSISLPRVIGHRGAAGLAPENTFAGLSAAAAHGLTWVEVDIRLTRDDRLVLLHDDILDRTTSGRGRVRDKTLAEISTLSAGAWFGAAFANERVPALDSYLDRALELRVSVNLEIKALPEDAAATARFLAVSLAEQRHVPPLLVSSFHHAAMTSIRSAAPHLPRGFLRRRLRTGWRRAAAKIAPSTVHLGARGLTKTRIAEARRLGLPLAVYTVNDPEDAQKLFDWGVDCLFTDRPDVLSAR